MNDDETQELLEDFIREGYLTETVGAFDEPRYNITEKFKEDFPEAASEWELMFSETLNSLWQKGLVNVDFSNSEQISVCITDKVNEQSLASLDERERDLLVDIAFYALRNASDN